MDNPLILSFLGTYAESRGWNELPDPPKGWDAISRKLCEEYQYDPKHGREFLLIAYGWMWGHAFDEFPYIKATACMGLLQQELDKVWKVVAKENGWEDV